MTGFSAPTGSATNRTLQATFGEIVDARQRIGDEVLRLRRDADLTEVSADLARYEDAMTTPRVDDRAVGGLKFSAALPVDLARSTVGERLGDPASAEAVKAEPPRLSVDAAGFS